MKFKVYFFANMIRSALTSAASNTFSAFPSGHCGLSWLTVVIAHRIGYVTYAKISGLAAALITLATLVLRYHYFVDALFSVVLVLFGALVGGFGSPKHYAHSLALGSTKDADRFSSSASVRLAGSEALPLTNGAIADDADALDGEWPEDVSGTHVLV